MTAANKDRQRTVGPADERGENERFQCVWFKFPQSQIVGEREDAPNRSS